MALVVLPEGTQISGSIGGTTWSRNRFGAYKRGRSMPVNPRTARQVAVRNAVRSLAIAWQIDLSQAQRDGWDQYGANVNWTNALGQSVNLTGLNHYVRSNTALVTAFLPRVDDAPTAFNIGAAELALSGIASEATQEISVGFDITGKWVDQDNAFEFISMGQPQNSGITFFGGPWRQFLRLAGDAVSPPTSPVSQPAPFPFAEGQRIWLRSRVLLADGRLSEFAEVNFLGVA